MTPANGTRGPRSLLWNNGLAPHVTGEDRATVQSCTCLPARGGTTALRTGSPLHGHARTGRDGASRKPGARRPTARDPGKARIHSPLQPRPLGVIIQPGGTHRARPSREVAPTREGMLRFRVFYWLRLPGQKQDTAAGPSASARHPRRAARRAPRQGRERPPAASATAGTSPPRHRRCGRRHHRSGRCGSRPPWCAPSPRSRPCRTSTSR